MALCLLCHMARVEVSGSLVQDQLRISFLFSCFHYGKLDYADLDGDNSLSPKPPSPHQKCPKMCMHTHTHNYKQILSPTLTCGNANKHLRVNFEVGILPSMFVSSLEFDASRFCCSFDLVGCK